MKLLDIQDLTKNFGGLTAVNSLSMSLETGQILGLIGPNGDGKSTVFNCIAGVYPPTSGKIVFKGGIELCGGTHVGSTGALGLFRFTTQGGVAAGVRRIEAVTGPGAYREVDQIEGRLDEVATALKAQPEHVARRLEQLLAERAKLEHRLADALKSGGSILGRKSRSRLAGSR